MQILAIEKPAAGAQVSHSSQDLKAEAVHIWHLYQTAVVRELYFREGRPEAVLILECQNVAEARRVLDALPLVRSGRIDFDIIPLIPYPGFGRLFSR